MSSLALWTCHLARVLQVKNWLSKLVIHYQFTSVVLGFQSTTITLLRSLFKLCRSLVWIPFLNLIRVLNIENAFPSSHLVASRKRRYMMKRPSGSMPWVIGKKTMEFSTVQMTTSKLGYPIWAKKMSRPGLFWNLQPCLWLQSELTSRPVISKTIVYFGWWYGGSRGSGNNLSLNGSSIAFLVVKILFFSLL